MVQQVINEEMELEYEQSVGVNIAARNLQETADN